MIKQITSTFSREGATDAECASSAQTYIECSASEIEKYQIYPRQDSYRDPVLLGLLDKVLTTSRAVIALVGAGFASEANGLSRTAVEAFLSLRYIENEDSESRAKRYLEYFGKDRMNLESFIIAKHHPHLSSKLDEETLMMAKNFKSAHQWLPEGVNVQKLAYAKSTWAVDKDGKPEEWEYSYDVIYKFTSHDVHATSVALYSKIASFSENSRYPPAFKFSKQTRRSDGDTAALNACIHLQGAIEVVFHGFGMQVPPKVREAFDSFLTSAHLPKIYS
jgi:hypothetical protein